MRTAENLDQSFATALNWRFATIFRGNEVAERSCLQFRGLRRARF